MKSIDETEAKSRLDEILHEADDSRSSSVDKAESSLQIVSAADYERLRVLNAQSFPGQREHVAHEAPVNGFTETDLADLIPKGREPNVVLAQFLSRKR